MSETVIRVENLGKKYIIGHQAKERYLTLRDTIANRTKALFNPFSQKQTESNQEEFWALKDITFEIKQGERVGVIGRNGAGKSTLLKVLSKITEPTTGQIRIKGRVASLLEVGTGFHPELTGRENIYLNGAILGMSRAEIRRKFDEIVDFAEVEKFLDTPVKRYSSGMYVRLAFAVAAHLEPEILIVDEVLAVGDAAFQKKCLGKMEDVSEREGRTVIFVSHNVSAISKLCSSGCVLEDGKSKFHGSIQGALDYYLSKQVNKSTRLDSENIILASSKLSPFFTLESFALKNDEDKIIDSVIDANSNAILELYLSGEVGEVSSRFNLGFTLENEKGDLLILSYFTDMPQEQWPTLERQTKLTMRALIDTSWLVEGTYIVRLISSLHCVKMLLTSDDNVCLTFQISGVRGSSPYNFINNRGCLLSPNIKWSFE